MIGHLDSGADEYQVETPSFLGVSHGSSWHTNDLCRAGYYHHFYVFDLDNNSDLVRLPSPLAISPAKALQQGRGHLVPTPGSLRF